MDLNNYNFIKEANNSSNIYHNLPDARRKIKDDIRRGLRSLAKPVVTTASGLKAFKDLDDRYTEEMGRGNTVKINGKEYGSGIDRSSDEDLLTSSDLLKYLRSAGRSDIDTPIKYTADLLADSMSSADKVYKGYKYQQDKELNYRRIYDSKKLIEKYRKEIDGLDRDIAKDKEMLPNAMNKRALSHAIRENERKRNSLQKKLDLELRNLRYYNSNLGKNLGKSKDEVRYNVYDDMIKKNIDRKDSLSTNDIPELEDQLSAIAKESERIKSNIDSFTETLHKYKELLAKSTSDEEKGKLKTKIEDLERKITNLKDKLSEVEKDRVNISYDLHSKRKELDDLKSFKFNSKDDLAAKIADYVDRKNNKKKIKKKEDKKVENLQDKNTEIELANNETSNPATVASVSSNVSTSSNESKSLEDIVKPNGSDIKDDITDSEIEIDKLKSSDNDAKDLSESYLKNPNNLYVIL